MLNAGRSVLIVTVMLVATAAEVAAQQPKTSQAFNQYVAQAEARIGQ